MRTKIFFALALMILMATLPVKSETIKQSSAIVIDGNEGFKKYSNATGTYDDPHILSFSIEGNGEGTLLQVKNTDQYFIVQKSFIAGGEKGIEFVNVKNGAIMNSIITDTKWGVYLQDSDSNLIGSNNITLASVWSIALYESGRNVIFDNLIDNAKPAGLQLSVHVYGHGLKSDPSDYNTIKGNTILNTGVAINGTGSTGLEISSNTIAKSHLGVYLEDMRDVTLQDNIIENNDEGVVVDNSTIIASGNKYSDNKDGNFIVVRDGGKTVFDTDQAILTVDTARSQLPAPIIPSLFAVMLTILIKRKSIRCKTSHE